MIGLTHGDNSFNDEVSIPVMGGTDVSPGVYDARIVCQRVYVTGGASQMQGVRELAQLILDKQVRMGRPHGVAVLRLTRWR